MARPPHVFLLGELLKNVSRSFYLTLRVLPLGLRKPVGLAYLLARAADTIADTALIPSEHRIELLLSLRAQINGKEEESALHQIGNEIAQSQIDSHERTLLSKLPEIFGLLSELDERDRAAVRNVVTTLTIGMEFDLRTFPDERSGQIGALNTIEELDHYTYLVAGCVGEFWTQMTCAHTPELSDWDVSAMSQCGIHFGKALQMTNILRDCAKDLRIGRCYLPLNLIAPLKLTPHDLLQASHSATARPVLIKLMRRALDHFREAERYTLAIPARCTRLRLACLWPILIGLETLLAHAKNDAWLDPSLPSKITRKSIYRIVACAFLVVRSDRLLKIWIARLITQIETRLSAY